MLIRLVIGEHMLNKKSIIIIIILSLLSLSLVSAIEFNIPSGYRQISSTTSTVELENNVGDYIIITDGDYVSYQDLITDLGNDYVISGIDEVLIDGNKVKEYRLSSESSTKYVYSFKKYGHTYNIGVSTDNILFWNAKSKSNPVYQIVSSIR